MDLMFRLSRRPDARRPLNATEIVPQMFPANERRQQQQPLVSMTARKHSDVYDRDDKDDDDNIAL